MTRMPDWMHRADPEILAHLHHQRLDYPEIIAVRLDMREEYAATRCRALAERGLVERVSEEAVFRITAAGERRIGVRDRPARDERLVVGDH